MYNIQNKIFLNNNLILFLSLYLFSTKICIYIYIYRLYVNMICYIDITFNTYEIYKHICRKKLLYFQKCILLHTNIYIQNILCLFFSLTIISYFELYILCVYDEEIVKEYDKIFK